MTDLSHPSTATTADTALNVWCRRRRDIAFLSRRVSGPALRRTSSALALATLSSVACEASEASDAPVQLSVLSVQLEEDLLQLEEDLFEGGGPITGTYWAGIRVALTNNTDMDVALGFPAFRVVSNRDVAHDASPVTEFAADGCSVGSYVVGGATASCRVVFALNDDELPQRISFFHEGAKSPSATVDIEICSPENPDLCGHRCVDLDTDARNCGACGQDVPGDCVDGALNCGALTECHGVCVDIQTDPANCGACGVTVPTVGACVGGEMVCVTAGYADCGDGVCADIRSDDANCGSCGVPVAGEDTHCEHGEATCNQGLTACDETCVDLASDLDNCGGCGMRCPLQEGDGYELRCARSLDACTVTFPTPGGTCTHACASAGWQCINAVGLSCGCTPQQSAGACDCRCSTALEQDS